MNKHQRLAMIIAPFLVVGGYIATDYYQKYKAAIAMQDKAGRLQLQGKCKLPEQPCVFKRQDLQITLHSDEKSPQQLSLSANYPLDGVTLSFARQPPVKMVQTSDQKHWQVVMPMNMTGSLRLVTSVQNTFYFAETQ